MVGGAEYNWTDMATAWAAIAGFALLVLGAIVATLQLSASEKAHKAQVLTDISRRWDEPLLAESRQEADAFEGRAADLLEELNRLRELNLKQYIVLKRIPNFFEDMAILVQDKAVTLELVEKSLGNLVGFYWRDYSPFILAERERQQDKTFHEHFEWLAAELAKPRPTNQIMFPP